MAEDGFEATTLARVVAESGIPESSVYHYYGSKDGILLAVMERGAERFFADLPESGPAHRTSSPAPSDRACRPRAETLERHPNFLRLLIVFAIQPPRRRRRGDGSRRRPRPAMALDRLRGQIAIAFDDDQTAPSRSSSHDSRWPRSTAHSSPRKPTPRITLEQLLEPLAPAVVAVRRALRAKAR